MLLAALSTAFSIAPGGATAQTAPRIVSIGGSVTEFVYALEADDCLIAVDATIRYPPEATAKPSVGYMRSLSAEPMVRLAIGPDHRVLLPASMLLGGALLLVADTAARTVVVPAELPIWILTSCVGGPFFLWLLLRRRAWGFG